MRIGTASVAPQGAAARARAVALDRAAARQHRHASAQARRARARRGRPRGVRPRPARARRARSATASSPPSCFPRRRRARSRCRCARARSTSSRAADHARDAPACRGRARRASRRSAAAASHRSRRITTATTLTALVAAEDGSWLERRTGDDPVALGRELAALAAVRVVVTRADAQAEPLAGRLEALGHDVVAVSADPDRAARRRADRPVAATTGSSSRARTAPRELARRLTATPQRLAAIGPGTAEALRAHGLERRPRPERRTPRTACSPSCLPGRVLFAAAEGARRLLVDERGADFVPLYRTVELRPPAPEGDVACSRPASAARALRRDRRADARSSRSARRRRPRRASTASRSSPRPPTQDVDGLLDAISVALTMCSSPSSPTSVSQDDFVGTCHGVMKRIAPEARSSTSRTGSSRRHVLQGGARCSRTRCRTCRPACISRSSIPASAARAAPLALRDAEGRLYVGPDNGLLLQAAESFGGVADCARARESGVRARLGVAHVPRARPLLAGRRASRRSVSRSATSGRRSIRTRSSGSRRPCPRSGSPDPGDACSASTASGTSR